MINILMNQKRGLNRLNDGDLWAPNNLLKPRAKEKHQMNPGGPSKGQEAPAHPTKMNSFKSRPS